MSAVKILYYVLYGGFGLLGSYFVLTSLLGRLTFGSASQPAAKCVLLVAAAAGGGLLYWAYALGEQQGRWGAGVGAVALAVVAFSVIMTLGRIALG